ncbi:HMG high mobility group box-containing protein [Nitzschia inconspicua]|uniref:HMG high mobility group box-containing protein n=1 Tax=Nitzschia inconspicua TaxID=303405 RepID=A0A9K3PRR1_9STRA|nr:HMG high mobility group box-containing protein [Nitzschia inconspicua]
MPPVDASAVMDFSRNSQGGANNGSDGNNIANSMNPLSNMNAMNDQELFLRLQASRAAGGGGGFAVDGMFGGAGMGAGTGGGDDEIFNQLMYARRLRALQLQQQQNAGDGAIGGAGHAASGTADDLLRLRQAGNATAATAAAMFSGSNDTNDLAMAQQQRQLQQQQQQFQHFQHFQQQVGYGFGGGPSGMFPSSMNMNMNLPLGAGPSFMMQAAAADHAFGGGRGFDDYILMTQHHHPQEAIRSGNADQQRLSPSRFLAFQQQQHQQQQNQQGLSGFSAMGTMDPFGGMSSMIMRPDKDGKLGIDPDKFSDVEKLSKKRYHKKKPSDMPRRPLSAYNLFFSEERERILQEIEAKEKGEERPKDADEEKASKDTKSKPKALLRPLLPSEKKRRPHRKTHGKISFRELAQMVGQRWKALPEEKRTYYQGLAKEDMVRQKKAMEEYYLKQSENVRVDKDDKELETKEDKDVSQGLSEDLVLRNES